MDLYTIICLFKGGSFVSQVAAKSPAEALDKWARTPDDQLLSSAGFSGKSELWTSVVLEKLADEDSQPVTLTGLQAVWYTLILIGRLGCHLNVVKTKP